MKEIEFWFSIGSTYTYLSVARLPALSREINVTFSWQLFSVRKIMQEMDNIPFPPTKKANITAGRWPHSLVSQGTRLPVGGGFSLGVVFRTSKADFVSRCPWLFVAHVVQSVLMSRVAVGTTFYGVIRSCFRGFV